MPEERTIEGTINPLLQQLRDSPIAGSGRISSFQNRDGLKIAYRIWGSEDDAQKIIVILHGLGGQSEFFVLLADHVVDLKIVVYAPDYRGHGLSEGKRGDIKDFNSYLDDTNEFLELIKKMHPNKPIFIAGESMGGCVAVNYQAKYPEDGLILFAPAVKQGVHFSVKDLLLIIGGFFIYLFNRGWAIIPARGREEQGIQNEIHRQYDATDPLHLDKYSPRYVLQILKYVNEAFREAVQIECPLLIFQGTKDSGVSPEGVEEFFNNCPTKDKTFHKIENGYHALMTDPCAMEYGLWEKLREWLQNHP